MKGKKSLYLIPAHAMRSLTGPSASLRVQFGMTYELGFERGGKKWRFVEKLLTYDNDRTNRHFFPLFAPLMTCHPEFRQIVACGDLEG